MTKEQDELVSVQIAQLIQENRQLRRELEEAQLENKRIQNNCSVEIAEERTKRDAEIRRFERWKKKVEKANGIITPKFFSEKYPDTLLKGEKYVVTEQLEDYGLPVGFVFEIRNSMAKVFMTTIEIKTKVYNEKGEEYVVDYTLDARYTKIMKVPSSVPVSWYTVNERCKRMYYNTIDISTLELYKQSLGHIGDVNEMI